MKITDRHIAIFSLIVSVGVLYYGWAMHRQSAELSTHLLDIKNNLKK